MTDSSPFPSFEAAIDDPDHTMRPLDFGSDPDYFIDQLSRDTTLSDLELMPSHVALSNIESHPATQASNSSSSHRGSTSSGSSRSIDGNSPNTTRTSMDEATADLPYDLFKFGHGNDDVMIEDSNDYAEFVNFETSPSNPDFSMTNGISPPAPIGQNEAPQQVIEPRQGPAPKRRKAPAAKIAKKPRERKKPRARSPKRVSPAAEPTLSNGSSPNHPTDSTPSPAGEYHDASEVFGPEIPQSWPNPHGFINTQFWQTGLSANAHGLPVYPNQQPVPPPPARPRLVIHPMPSKSRVETQIQLKVTLHNLPKGIKRVHLPTYAIAKTKLLHNPPLEPHPDMLNLSTMLVCTTAMYDQQSRERALANAAKKPLIPVGPSVEEEDPQNGGEVRICDNCINRERKRAGRKKHKKVEEEELWNKYQSERAIVINTQEVKDWQIVTPSMADPTGAGLHSSVPEGTVQVETPMRIACYCRHHSEKNGFRVIITLRDFQGNLVAQEMSGSIMITDDHKTSVPSQPLPDQQPDSPHHQPVSNGQQMAIPPQSSALQPYPANTVPSPPQPHHVGAPVPVPFQPTQPDPRQSAALPIRPTQSTPNLGNMTETAPFQPLNHHVAAAPVPRTLAQAPPTSPPGASRKRKASISSKLPAGLAMTKIETNQPSNIMPGNFHNEPPPMASAGNSPYAQSSPQYPMNGDMMNSQGQQQMFANNMRAPFGPGRMTPNGGEQPFPFAQTNGTMGLDLSLNQMFSAPASAHQSRAPSPTHHSQQHTINAQRTQEMMAAFTAPRPAILRIIPPEGPKSGGVEITILGRNFTNDGLEVYFGPHKATTTTWWGETSLVCMLPPSPTAGRVPVTIQQPGKRPSAVTPSASFTYVDDDEQQLLRTAITILGHKFTGSMTDAMELAKKIVMSEGGGGGGNNPNFGAGFDMNMNNPGNNLAALESDLLRILELIDMDDSSNKPRINLRRSSGQTMLHLACSVGLDRFVAGLLSRGASVNMKDKGGFTPLHMAAMNDRPDIVRRLIAKGADRNAQSNIGLTPAAVAASRAVLSNLHVQTRSRSVGSLHSRASSTASLSSLWGHTQSMPTRSQEFLSDSNDSSREPASSEENTSEEEDIVSFSRRASLADPRRRTSTTAAHVNVERDLAAPNATMSVLREQLTTQMQQIQHALATLQNNIPQFQFQQLQNSVTTQIQNLGGQMMPDYLHTAPVMQRISSLVPNIRSPRILPENPPSPPVTDDQGSNKKWGVLPFFGVKDVPPAYEEIFPQKVMDIKQGSAARAAAESEADAKCEVLYDQSSSDTVEEAEQSTEIPTTLEIGRKHRITKQQQETLQRAHAQSLKTGSRDKMLWFVWIPILVLVLGAMLYSGASSFASGTAGIAKTFADLVANPREIGDRVNRYLLELA